MYKINPKDEDGIIDIVANDLITYSQIQNMLYSVTRDNSDDAILYASLDYRNCTIELGDTFLYTTLSEIKEGILKVLNTYEAIYAAYIVQDKTKNNVVIELFHKLFDNDERYITEVFQDKAIARKWLLEQIK